MYTKKYLCDTFRLICLELLEGGFVGAFEELLSLVESHDPRSSRDRDLREDGKGILDLARMLRRAESEERRGKVESSIHARMDLANLFQAEIGYLWLSESMFESCIRVLEMSEDGRWKSLLQMELLQKLALLEEKRDNEDLASAHLERALRLALQVGDPGWRDELCGDLMRVYLRRGKRHLEEESVSRKEESKGLFYCKKAARLAPHCGAESRASCHALLGRAMLQFNDTRRALKHLESYLELSASDAGGKCDALLSLCEVHRRLGSLEQAEQCAMRCRELAQQEPGLAATAAVLLGQMETAKRRFPAALRFFDESRRLAVESGGPLDRVCRVMCGVGRSHLRPPPTNFHRKELDLPDTETEEEDAVERMVREELAH